MGNRKRKGKIKFKQNAQLLHKKDKTDVARKDTAYSQAPTKTYITDNAATFKIKIRKKK